MEKNKIIIFLLSVIFIFSFFVWQNKNAIHESNVKIQEKQKNEEQQYQIEKVIDGDTVILKIDGKNQKIRLIGLNTPEARNFKDRKIECFGKEASQRAKEILSGKTVKIELDESQSKYDKYGRLLAYLYFLDENNHWQNFAEKMITDGYGYEYTYHGQKYKYQTEFKNAQKTAQKNKKGLWADGVCE